MAQWYHFYHVEDEAEILVGLYDRWLSQLAFGPTQAERFLVHTEIMETAHERRFAVAQTTLDMSDFQTEHSVRIKETVEHLERHFISRVGESDAWNELRVHHRRKASILEVEHAKRVQDDSVIEMMGCFGSETLHEGPASHCQVGILSTPPPLDRPRLGYNRCESPIPITVPISSATVELKIDVDEFGSEASLEEQYGRAVAYVSANSAYRRGWGPSSRPKTIREVRVRKKIKLKHDDEVRYKEEGSGSPHKTSMSLQRILN